jgi:hypothetical protein
MEQSKAEVEAREATREVWRLQSKDICGGYMRGYDQFQSRLLEELEKRAKWLTTEIGVCNARGYQDQVDGLSIELQHVNSFIETIKTLLP